MHGRIDTRPRVYAALLDLGIILFIVAGLTFAPSLVHQKPVASAPLALVGMLLAELFSLFDALSSSGTPGKMLMRLRVTQSNGRRAPDSALIARWFIKYVPLHVATLEVARFAIGPDEPGAASLLRIFLLVPDLLAVVVCTGYLLVFDDLRQSLHDILTDTAVFDASVDDRATGFAVLPAAEPLDLTPGHTPDRPTGGSDRSAPRPSIPLARPRTS